MLIKETSRRRDIFEIVNEFPDGYIVWAIGRQNFPFPGYLPLAKLIEPYSVSVTELKAIKVDEQVALRILRLAVTGVRGHIDKTKFTQIINSNL